MSVLVTGSVALDTIETPYGRVESVLGGSAVYFALAASYFSPVRLIGVVGEDFPQEHVELLRSRGVDTSGLHVVEGKTFRWQGRYAGQMADAETVLVQFNVLDGCEPEVPPAFMDSPFVFLANASPVTQMAVLARVTRPEFVLADTMNIWIETQREPLLELLGRVDGLILNASEARTLAGDASLVGAAEWLCERGPRYCIIKKGEHGSLMRAPTGVFALPAFPARHVKDPTGAGDAFAGGLMGYLAAQGQLTDNALKMGLAYGTVTASFAIADFGPSRLQAAAREDIEERLRALVGCTQLGGG